MLHEAFERPFFKPILELSLLLFEATTFQESNLKLVTFTFFPLLLSER